MSIALWCMLAVVLAPYLLSVLGRSGAPRHEYVQDPRAYSVFVVARLLHGISYIGDKPVLRSHSWRVGILCVIGLFVVAAVDGAPVGARG